MVVAVQAFSGEIDGVVFDFEYLESADHLVCKYRIRSIK